MQAGSRSGILVQIGVSWSKRTSIAASLFFGALLLERKAVWAARIRERAHELVVFREWEDEPRGLGCNHSSHGVMATGSA
jgi:hypothetical protein